MLRNLLLVLLLCAFSVQTLAHRAASDTASTNTRDYHGLLHFTEQPHSHDANAPEQVTLSSSAEARQHVAQDMCGCTPALLQYALPDASPVYHNADAHFAGHLPEPYLHRATPPPRA